MDKQFPKLKYVGDTGPDPKEEEDGAGPRDNVVAVTNSKNLCSHKQQTSPSKLRTFVGWSLLNCSEISLLIFGSRQYAIAFIIISYHFRPQAEELRARGSCTRGCG